MKRKNQNSLLFNNPCLPHSRCSHFQICLYELVRQSKENLYENLLSYYISPPTRPPTRKPTTSSPRTTTTTTTLPPIPVAPVIASVPVSVPAPAVASQPKPNTRPSRPTFSKPKPKIHQPKVQQPVSKAYNRYYRIFKNLKEQPAPASPQKHIIVQPTYVEVTAKSSQPKTNPTQAHTSVCI